MVASLFFLMPRKLGTLMSKESKFDTDNEIIEIVKLFKIQTIQMMIFLYLTE